MTPDELRALGALGQGGMDPYRLPSAPTQQAQPTKFGVSWQQHLSKMADDNPWKKGFINNLTGSSTAPDPSRSWKPSGDFTDELNSAYTGYNPDGSRMNRLMQALTILGMPMGGGVGGGVMAAKAPVGAVAGPIYRSRLQPAIEGLKQDKMGGAQARGTLENTPGGISADEMEFTGVGQLLDDPTVTKHGLLEKARDNAIEIQDVRKGGIDLSEYDNYGMEDFNIAVEQATASGNTNELRRLDLAERAHIAETMHKTPPPEISAGGPTKFHEGSMGSQETVLPGGEDYKELLLTLPGKTKVVEKDGKFWIQEPDGGTSPYGFNTRQDAQNLINTTGDGASAQRSGDYTGGHYDEPNVLSHARYNTRQIDGDKTLFIEEIQSDWHQAGRKKGYAGGSVEKYTVKENDGVWEILDPDGQLVEIEHTQAAANDAARQFGEGANVATTGGGKVPDAPFKKNWHDLTFKRMIREASDGGHDRIAWTPGEVQADRYDLSKQISKVNLSTTSGGVGRADSGEFQAGMLEAYDLDGQKVINKYISSPDELADHIGKDAADKLLASKGEHGNSAAMGRFTRSIKDQDLKVGGEGMKGFYDKMMVKAANKFAKKYGQKVEVKGLGGKKANADLLGDDLWYPWRDGGDVDMSRGYKTEAAAKASLDQGVWSLKLTPEMKKDIQKGIALGVTGLLGAEQATRGLLQKPVEN